MAHSRPFCGNRRSDLHLRVFAAPVQLCEMKQPSLLTPGIQLRREPSILAGYGMFLVTCPCLIQTRIEKGQGIGSSVIVQGGSCHLVEELRTMHCAFVHGLSCLLACLIASLLGGLLVDGTKRKHTCRTHHTVMAERVLERLRWLECEKEHLPNNVVGTRYSLEKTYTGCLARTAFQPCAK